MRNLTGLKKDKRGIYGIIVFFIILFSILIIGFIASMVVGVIDYGSDEITPVMKDLGMVEDYNMSGASTYTFGVMDTFVQSLPWIIAFAYVVALIFSVLFVMAYSSNPHPAFIGVYIAFIFLLILGSIILSNAYQDIYEGGDEIASRLQEQTALSYMILYSPFIMTLIAFITGIYLFTGRQDEGGTV